MPADADFVRDLLGPSLVAVGLAATFVSLTVERRRGDLRRRVRSGQRADQHQPADRRRAVRSRHPDGGRAAGHTDAVAGKVPPAVALNEGSRPGCSSPPGSSWSGSSRARSCRSARAPRRPRRPPSAPATPDRRIDRHRLRSEGRPRRRDPAGERLVRDAGHRWSSVRSPCSHLALYQAPLRCPDPMQTKTEPVTRGQKCAGRAAGDQPGAVAAVAGPEAVLVRLAPA